MSSKESLPLTPIPTISAVLMILLSASLVFLVMQNCVRRLESHGNMIGFKVFKRGWPLDAVETDAEYVTDRGALVGYRELPDVVWVDSLGLAADIALVTSTAFCIMVLYCYSVRYKAQLRLCALLYLALLLSVILVSIGPLVLNTTAMSR